MPLLSICIATYKRAEFISETLDSIVCQLTDDVEVVIVDGASPDATPDIVHKYASSHRQIRYFRERQNCGVDQDYDKAVHYAHGQYCWLMTDDDILVSNAIQRVTQLLSSGPELLIANAEIRNVDLTKTLEPRRLNITSDRRYLSSEHNAFFSECMDYISFIGCVIIKRDLWLRRLREPYYGSLFIHVGVICQSPLSSPIHVIAAPLIVIRYGNAMWTARGFEIWTILWPRLIWSFPSYSEQAKKSVCAADPGKSFKMLLYFQAVGGFNYTVFKHFYKDRSLLDRTRALLVALIPAKLANLVSVLFILLFRRGTSMRVLVDLLQSKHATILTRVAAKTLNG